MELPDPTAAEELSENLQEQWLVADLSNSSSKFALATPKELLTVRRVATAALSIETLETITQGWALQRVIVASVVPEATSIVKLFIEQLGIPLLSIDVKSDLGVMIDYPDRSSMGADRLANIIAVQNRYRTPCIVANFGTAIVFDIINEQSAYLGGIIAPGLFTGAKALHQNTALLPQILPSPIQQALGKSTVLAIQSGLLLGARGLVREVVEQITRETFLGKHPTVIATGTDALLVAGEGSLFDHIELNLTLEGIREAGCRMLFNLKT